MKSSRKEAIKCGDNFYMTGNKCVNNHISKRNVRDGSCHEFRIDRQRSARREISKIKKEV